MPNEMVQELKAPATKSDNMNLSSRIPKFHIHSGRSEPILCKLSSDLHTYTPWHAHSHAHTHINVVRMVR